eukprot:1150743-Pelagomonas_calceolata.AAC.4
MMYVYDVCQHNYHWKCPEKVCCYTDKQRQEVQIAETCQWACPACAGLGNGGKFNRETNSREELLKISWIPQWEPEKAIWPTSHQRMQEFEAQQSKPNLLLRGRLPTADLALSNLERQEFSKPDANNTRKQILLCDRITFDIHPTNPQTDIKPTSSCRFWIQEIDLVKHNPKPPPKQTPAGTVTHTPPSTTVVGSTTPTLILPEIYRPRVACIYNTDGKCVGMMTPDRFDVLHKAFHKAKALGLHSNICPPTCKLCI